MVGPLVNFAGICPGTDERLCLATFIPVGYRVMDLPPPSKPPVDALRRLTPVLSLGLLPFVICPL